MNVRFYSSYVIEITFKSHFCRKRVIVLSLCTQHCYGRHNVSQKSWNILHGVISLPNMTSCDKSELNTVRSKISKTIRSEFLFIENRYLF